MCTTVVRLTIMTERVVHVIYLEDEIRARSCATLGRVTLDGKFLILIRVERGGMTLLYLVN